MPGWHALRLAIPALLTILALALAACAGPEAPGSGTPGQGAQGAAPGSGQGAAREGQETGPTGDQPPLTYLICFEPGGQSDIEARRQQPHLERILGRKVVIDYKVGGGGALCWSELARSRPDGSMVAGINLPHIILQPLQQETGYRTEQIEPVAFFQSTPLGLAVLKSSPYRTLADLLNDAREKPGEISVGGSGTFSGHHAATVRLERAAGVDLAYVPFNGAAPQMTAFLGGHVTAVVANSNDLVKYADRIRVLAIAAEERFPGLPDVPTFRELGLDVVERIDRGVGVPAGTPEPVIRELEKAFLQIARDPAIRAQMEEEGFVPLALGHDESKKQIQALTEAYRSLATDLRQ
ncbi:MAG TPA: tripartite tricarboxylate transporter substrate binding protein [Thermaerobacter sp.]